MQIAPPAQSQRLRTNLRYPLSSSLFVPKNIVLTEIIFHIIFIYYNCYFRGKRLIGKQLSLNGAYALPAKIGYQPVNVLTSVHFYRHRQTHLHGHQDPLRHTYAKLNTMMTKGHVWAPPPGQKRGEFRSWETGVAGRTLLHRVFVTTHRYIHRYINLYVFVSGRGDRQTIDAVGESWRWYFAHHGVQSTSELYNHVFCFLTQNLWTLQLTFQLY